MAEAENLPTLTGLPLDDAVLADISGIHGLPQAELWDAVGQVDTGNLASWVLMEATRMQKAGVSSRDAFLGGVGYVVLALTRQASRNADKEKVAALWATLSDVDEASVASTDTA